MYFKGIFPSMFVYDVIHLLSFPMHAPRILLWPSPLLSHCSQSDICQRLLAQQERGLLAWGEERVASEPLSRNRNESVPVSFWRQFFCLVILSPPSQSFILSQSQWKGSFTSPLLEEGTAAASL